MATKALHDPPPGQVITGLIYSSSLSLGKIMDEIIPAFGPVAMTSEQRPFTWTNYYAREMGEGLSRIFLAMERLVNQDFLVSMKHASIEIEKKLSMSGRRRVNIDPGILTAERLVLATTKNFTHRVYLGQGIFADLTLIYRKGSFRPLEWTYPDYRDPWSLAFWAEVRKYHLSALNALKRKGKTNA